MNIWTSCYHVFREANIKKADSEEELARKNKIRNQWKKQVTNNLSKLSQKLRISNLIDIHLVGIDELVIIPHLLLHQIPFAALPIDNNRYLLDQFRIRYVPSCQILEICHDRQKQPQADTFAYGIIENTLEDLPCTSFEADQIAQLYNISSQQRLKGAKVTAQSYLQLVRQVRGIHACHHAKSFLDAPLKSELQLANGNITLEDLLSPSWHLPHLCDVFLSCCETNLGVADITDNLLTIATGFLCAGAQSVVSALWIVEDVATALLATFYYQHRKQNRSRPEALRQAQIQLRNLTRKEFLSRPDVQKLNKQVRERYEQIEARTDEARTKWQEDKKQDSLADYEKWSKLSDTYFRTIKRLEGIQDSSKEYPFDHPYLWAAFVCQGLS